jgi:hypothetical protein
VLGWSAERSLRLLARVRVLILVRTPHPRGTVHLNSNSIVQSCLSRVEPQSDCDAPVRVVDSGDTKKDAV